MSQFVKVVRRADEDEGILFRLVPGTVDICLQALAVAHRHFYLAIDNGNRFQRRPPIKTGAAAHIVSNPPFPARQQFSFLSSPPDRAEASNPVIQDDV
jgi:hypothetical protein